MIFNLPPICGLFPLLLYIVLAFKKGMHPLVNVSICAVVGAIMVKQHPHHGGAAADGPAGHLSRVRRRHPGVRAVPLGHQRRRAGPGVQGT